MWTRYGNNHTVTFCVSGMDSKIFYYQISKIVDCSFLPIKITDDPFVLIGQHFSVKMSVTNKLVTRYKPSGVMFGCFWWEYNFYASCSTSSVTFKYGCCNWLFANKVL